MQLRRLLIATHRDFGYFFAGMTVLYAISGIAVNHVEDWNPNYAIRAQTHEVGRLPEADRHEVAREVLRRMAIAESPNTVARTSPRTIKVFLEDRTLTVSLPQGSVHDERARRRTGLFELNYLHLNHGKGFWTWFADLYAAGLLVLACTGIFIISGREGLRGRGLWLLLAGLSVPVVYLVWML